MCQISTLALDQTTGETGMGSPQASDSRQICHGAGGGVLFGITIDKDSDLGQMLERPVS